MGTKHISNEEFKENSFGEQRINIQIPKFTDVMIITTISQARNGTQNVSTNTYGSEEIEELLREE